MNRRNFLAAASAAAGLRLRGRVLGRGRLEPRRLRTRSAWIARSAARTWTGLLHVLPSLQEADSATGSPDHLEFHRTYNTDIVKVNERLRLSEIGDRQVHELKPLAAPFRISSPRLKIIRDG